MHFSIHTQDSQPIYKQIVEQVRRWVASGSAQVGEELPSVRQLAQLHAINPMTVSKAYCLLEAEGLLERRRGMGMFVRAGSVLAAPCPADLLRPSLQSAAAHAAQLGWTRAQALELFDECLAAQGLAETAMVHAAVTADAATPRNPDIPTDSPLQP